MYVQKCKRKRDETFLINQNSEETWTKVILEISRSQEISQNFRMLQALDPYCKLTNEILGYSPNTLVTLTKLIHGWREINNRYGSISKLIGVLILLRFEETGNLLGTIINNDGNSVIFDMSSRQGHNFYGRREILDQMAKHAINVDTRKVNLFVITGSFGIGKSFLALEFGNKFQKIFDGNVIRLDGTALEREFLLLAQTLNIAYLNKDFKTILRECYDHFECTKSLFIFDNVESYNEILKFLPSDLQKPLTIKPFILITTRDNNSWQMNGIPMFNLNVLSNSDSIDFLRNELIYVSHTENELSELGAELGYYPLAMKHACQLIKKISRKFILPSQVQLSPVQEFLAYNRLENEGLYLKDSENDNYSSPMFSLAKSIFPKLFQRFKIDRDQEDTLYKILIYLIYGSPAYIPKYLIQNLNYGFSGVVLEVLENYSILYECPVDKQFFIMHQAVQKPFRFLLLSLKGFEKVRNLFGNLLQDINNFISPIKYEVLQFNYIMPFIATFEFFSAHILNFDMIKEQCEFIQNLWHFYHILDYPTNAYFYSKKILEKLQLSQKTNETNISIIDMKIRYGISLIYQYKQNEAYELLKELYATSKQNEGIPTLRLEVGIWLAFILGRIGLVQDSEQLYMKILSLSNHASDPIYRIRARTGLAELESSIGKFNESVFNFLSSCDDAVIHLGPNHYETLRIPILFALACLKTDNETLIEIAYGIIKPRTQLLPQILGYNNFSTLKSFNLLSRVLMKQNKLNEAKAVLETICPYLEQIVPTTNPLFLEITEHLSIVNQDLKLREPSDTLNIQLQIIQTKTEILKYDLRHFSFLESLENIGDTYCAIGNFAEAKFTFEKVYKVKKIMFGKTNPLTKTAMSKLKAVKVKLSESKSVDKSQSSGSRSMPFECKECSIQFKYRKTLLKHIRNRHTRELDQRPSCPNCGKKLYDNYGVNRHQESCKGTKVKRTKKEAKTR